MESLKIIIPQSIDITHFEDIIITALEGGSNYWYYIKHDDMRAVPRKSGEADSEAIARHLYNDSKFKLDIYDYESEDDLLGTITQESLLNAIKLAQKEYPNIYYDLLEGTGDAETADILFQLAVMGMVVFG